MDDGPGRALHAFHERHHGASGTVRYRVRAIDGAGNSGAWRYWLT